MPTTKKPFVVYRRGPGNFTIVPRGLIGWAQFALWIALLAPLAVWFSNHSETHGKGEEFLYGPALLGAGVLVWAVGGIWWMLARGEVVDVAQLMRDKQLERRKRRRSQ